MNKKNRYKIDSQSTSYRKRPTNEHKNRMQRRSIIRCFYFFGIFENKRDR